MLSETLSLDCVFAFVLGLEVGGAYELSRGLLASPGQIVRRSTPYWDFSAPLAVEYAENEVDGRSGLLALGFGFLVQIAGYVLAAGNWRTGHNGTSAALVALVSALFAVTVVLLSHRAVRVRLVRRVLSRVVMVDSRTGEQSELARWEYVRSIGHEIGESLTEDEESALQGGDGASRYAQRVFGVRGVAPEGVEVFAPLSGK